MVTIEFTEKTIEIQIIISGKGICPVLSLYISGHNRRNIYIKQRQLSTLRYRTWVILYIGMFNSTKFMSTFYIMVGTC